MLQLSHLWLVTVAGEKSAAVSALSRPVVSRNGVAGAVVVVSAISCGVAGKIVAVAAINGLSVGSVALVGDSGAVKVVMVLVGDWKLELMDG